MAVTRRDVVNASLGGVGGAMLGRHIHGRNALARRRRHSAARAERRYERRTERHLKKDRADQMKYNKKLYQSEKQANKAQAEFLKKYGGEKFQKYEVQNREQKGLHKAINKNAEKEISKRKAPSKLADIQKNKAFKTGERSVIDQLKNPGITDIKQSPLYQQQGSYLQNLLSESPQAYENFKAPAMREYRNEIAREAARYGNQRGSGFQKQILKHAGNISERLQAHRSALQMEALNEIPSYLNAPLQGQELRHRTLSQAQQVAGNFAQAPISNQQQDIANRYNYDSQSGSLAGLGLGTAPFGTHYRAPTAPSQIITGGPFPVNRAIGNPPQAAQPSPPSFLQQLAGAALPAAGAAAGTVIGGPVGGAIGGGIGNGLNSAFNQPVQQGAPVSGGYQQPRAAGRGNAWMQENAPTGNMGPWQAPPSRFRG